MPSAPCILYHNCIPNDRVCEMTHAGIRRYGERVGWEVEPIPKTDSTAELRAILRERRPQGCLVWIPGARTPLSPRLFSGIPTVFLGMDPASRSACVSRLDFDEAAIARAAFRELSSGKPDVYATVIFRRPIAWSLARETAFRALAAAAGKPCLMFRKRVRPVVEPDDVRTRRLVSWIGSLPSRCAVFAVNDDAAAEIVAAAHATGRRIPHDLTLLGVDNDELICEAAHPSISSIQMDFENAGFLAARLLAETMKNRAPRGMATAATAANGDGDPPAAITIGPLLAVRRESTSGTGRREPHILAAMEMIRREACDGLTARALASRFPGSRRLFELRFREAIGHSVLDEIQNARLREVHALLAHTNTAIGAIPALCGYRSDIALRKFFREREGMSMQEWRRRNGH